MKWCSVDNAFVAALTSGSSGAVNTLTAIGSGFSNTKMMLGSCTYGAANMAASYNGGGKSDWFLPSKGDINQLCKWARAQDWISDATVCSDGGTLNLGTGAGLGAEGFVLFGSYWSSSEGSADGAWYSHFNIGNQGNFIKSGIHYVRPIRAF
jgi:hypothetical protein